ELPRRVEIPRPEAVRHDVAALACAVDERLHLGDACGIDERLDADVVAVARLCDELVERALRLEVDVPAREDLVRLVLRRLDVRLVERVDADDPARDRDRKLPAKELLPELVRI